MAVPNIQCSIEPLVNGKLVYLPVAPPQKGKPASGMVAFAMRVTNNEQAPNPQTPAPTLALKSLRVAFPGSDVAPVSYARNEQIKPSQAEWIYLDEARDKTEEVREAIRIPASAPAEIEITLTFAGFDPWKDSWALARHASPTPE